MARVVSLSAPSSASLSAPSSALDFRQGLLESFAVNERINQLILDHMDPRAWRAKPAGPNARTMAAIFTHMHNMRRKWVRLSAPHLESAAATRSRTLHATAGPGCACEKRSLLPGNA